MPYIGKSPAKGVRNRFYYTATGGETSISGTDDNSRTLTFSDGAYVDVYLNGVLLVDGTDYNTSTSNTISGLSALILNDIVEILVYDVFSVAGLSNYFTSARIPFTKSDSTVSNIPLNADQQVPFTKADGSASNFALTN